MKPIEIAIKACGTQTSLAEKLGVKQPTVSEWLRDERQVPKGRCPDIERITGGSVTADELRPDVRWLRIPDPSWPHPGGRPCIDVALSHNQPNPNPNPPQEPT